MREDLPTYAEDLEKENRRLRAVCAKQNTVLKELLKSGAEVGKGLLEAGRITQESFNGLADAVDNMKERWGKS